MIIVINTANTGTIDSNISVAVSNERRRNTSQVANAGSNSVKHLFKLTVPPHIDGDNTRCVLELLKGSNMKPGNYREFKFRVLRDKSVSFTFSKKEDMTKFKNDIAKFNLITRKQRKFHYETRLHYVLLVVTTEVINL